MRSISLMLLISFFMLQLLTKSESVAAPPDDNLQPTFSELFKKYILPNLGMPSFDASKLHYEKNENGHTIKHIEIPFEIPQKSPISFPVLNYDDDPEHDLFLIAGDYNFFKSEIPKEEFKKIDNLYFVGHIIGEGTKGIFGDQGTISLKVVTNPEDLNTEVFYPIVLPVENTGNIYIKLNSLVGSYTVNYKEKLCAVNTQRAQSLCEPQHVKGLDVGDSIEIIGVKYKIKKDYQLYSMNIHFNVKYAIKMADPKHYDITAHRTFLDRSTNFYQDICIHKDCKESVKFFIDQDFLNPGIQ